MADERLDEMASTMKAELEANGYVISWQACYECSGDYVGIDTPDGWNHRYADIEIDNTESLKDHNKRKMNEAIGFAYKHLTEKRRMAELEAQHAAMKALLAELYHGYVDSEPNYDITPLAPFENWLKRVKTLLGKE